MRILFAFLVLLLGAAAAAAPVELHYFWAPGCPDCAAMKELLAALAVEFPELQVVDHEVAWGNEAFELMAAVAESYGLASWATPLVAVGGVATTGIGLAVELALREEIARCAREGCPSPLARVSSARHAPGTPSPGPRIAILLVGLAVVLLALWTLTR